MDDVPSDLQIRLDLMGFNFFTYAGFALAILLLGANTLLGTGWASRLIGFDENLIVSRDLDRTVPTWDVKRLNKPENLLK